MTKLGRGVSEADVWNVRQQLVRAKRRLKRTAAEIVQMEKMLALYDTDKPNSDDRCWHCSETNLCTTDLEMCEIANANYPHPCREFKRG